MSKPFHVYLDLDVMNNDTSSGKPPPQLTFEETRNQPFLEGTADDYFVAIARFTIQTGSSLPVFIPQIATGQSNYKLTVYTVSLATVDAGQASTAGTYEALIHAPFSSTITYTPSNVAPPLPSPPTNVQDLSCTTIRISSMR